MLVTTVDGIEVDAVVKVELAGLEDKLVVGCGPPALPLQVPTPQKGLSTLSNNPSVVTSAGNLCGENLEIDDLGNKEGGGGVLYGGV